MHAVAAEDERAPAGHGSLTHARSAG
jgi:hypothetical protein